MSSKQNETPLKIIFLPFPEAGHIFPMADLTQIISSQDVECTIITTPANTSYFQTNGYPNMIIRTLTFPGSEVGLPSGVENFGSITSPDQTQKLFNGISMLRNPIEDLIREISPDCIVSDMYFPWTSDLANDMNVPRVFQAATTFTLCCWDIVKTRAPHEPMKNDDDLVELPLLHHKIVMKKSQLPEWVRIPNQYTRLMDIVTESKLKSYGVLVNTFPCDEEKEYGELYNKLFGLKVWNVGPLCLQATRNEEIRESVDDCWMNCQKWLDKKKPNSVLYVSFGSMTRFPDDQLREIAAGLESSGHDFIWVVRKKKKIEGEEEKDDGEWSVEEFRKKMEESNKGFIIENWAPQVLILKHKSIGGMVTHCGSNSILEGVVVSGGLPLVTWPLFAEQFYNERLVVDVLKIGFAVGVSEWCNTDKLGTKEIVRREKVEAAVRAVMGDGEESVKMRVRVRELSEGAKKGVENGGSSRADLVAFLDELKAKRMSKAMQNE